MTAWLKSGCKSPRSSQDRKGYSLYYRQTKPTKEMHLISDHESTDFIALLPEGETTPSVQQNEDMHESLGCKVNCKVCYMLTACPTKLRSKAEAVYHMTAK